MSFWYRKHVSAIIRQFYIPAHENIHRISMYIYDLRPVLVQLQIYTHLGIAQRSVRYIILLRYIVETMKFRHLISDAKRLFY